MQGRAKSLPATPWAEGIRFKLLAVFTVVALLAVGFACTAIVVQVETVDRVTSWEAERLANVVAYGGAIRTLEDRAALQAYVDQLRAIHKNDIVFVDTARVGIADADVTELGVVFSHDPDGEVGKTLRDGVARSFVERNDKHSRGIRNTVVAVRADPGDSASPIVGAAIVEYTNAYDELPALELRELYLLVFVAVVGLLASGFFGLRLARKLAGRLDTLQGGVSMVAEGYYDISVPVRGNDEIDRLSAGFNLMAQGLKQSREKLLEHGRSLEDRLAAMHESEARYRSLFELSPDGMLIHVDGRIVLVNARCVAFLGATSPEQLIGKQILDIFHPDHRQGASADAAAPCEEGGSPTEEKMLRLDGSEIEAEVTESAFIYKGMPGIQMVLRDLAERRKAEERMAYLAKYDSLTGLPNRHLFGDRLTQAMARADLNQQPMALMFADLDHFKAINDSLGHAVGDEVLKAISNRLRETLRGVDSIARLGGDEFTLILEQLGDPADAVRVAEKIKQALAAPVVVSGREFVVSASIGIAFYPSAGKDSDSLLQAADIAMYRAKEMGRNTHALFAVDMAVKISERARMGALLRFALERNEFELHYQPMVELASGRIVGVEALLRWTSGELGAVPPVRFIPLAEELGLIVPIGEWVLRTACAQGRAWQLQGLPALAIAVNVSPRQLHDPGLIEKISQVLLESGFPAELLELELTEGLIMDDAKGNIEMLKAVRQLGVSLAIDDFGTGYSSLAYLARLPVQTLKIDRTFITPMANDANAMTLVSTMVTLAHSLGLKVVAEGVETEQQRRLLRSLGCDLMQGYGFSPAIDADSLAALLRVDVPSLLPRNRIHGSSRSAGSK